MIVSRPKGATIVSFSLFTAITLVVLIMNLVALVNTEKPAWYNFAIVGLLIPILVVVVYRIFIRYKIVSFGNNQVEIRFPVLFRKKSYPLAKLEHWKEHRVATGKSSAYREVELVFDDRKKISLGYQEYSEYDRIIKYLNQKKPKGKK